MKNVLAYYRAKLIFAIQSFVVYVKESMQAEHIILHHKVFWHSHKKSTRLNKTSLRPTHYLICSRYQRRKHKCFLTSTPDASRLRRRSYRSRCRICRYHRAPKVPASRGKDILLEKIAEIVVNLHWNAPWNRPCKWILTSDVLLWLLSVLGLLQHGIAAINTWRSETQCVCHLHPTLIFAGTFMVLHFEGLARKLTMQYGRKKLYVKGPW